MHACGHDTHVTIVMGVAELLAGMKKDSPGTVKFMFQPAEEGPTRRSHAESRGNAILIELDHRCIEAMPPGL